AGLSLSRSDRRPATLRPEIAARRRHRRRARSCAASHAVDMPEITARGITFHYEEAGAGEPLVLLHGGLGTGALHWWRELSFFARCLRVIAPDMRGYGRSTPPRNFPPDFYRRDAEDMAALIRATGAAPAHVLGWSDGGVVALILAAEHPEVVRSLITVAGE